MADDGALLTAENITKVFGGLVAVEDVTFRVPERGIVSIIGPNGAGKTTFFNMLTGLYRPTYGRITFEGTDGSGKKRHPAPSVRSRWIQSIAPAARSSSEAPR